MPTQLSKIAFIEEGDLSKTKVFSVFQEGAENASRQVLSIEANTAILENNRELITSKVYTIDVVGLYSQADKSQLYTWASNRTKLYVSGYGLDGSILQAYGAISVVDGYENNASFRFRFQVESKGGYNATTGMHNASMSYSKNALALYNWQEGSTANVPAGWTLLSSTGSPSYSFDGSQRLIISCDDSSTVSLNKRVYFPFAGKTLHFSVSVDQVAGAPFFSVSLFNANGSIVGTGASNVFISNKTNQINVTSAEDAVYAALGFVGTNNSAVELSNPSLTLFSDVYYDGNQFNT